ncbi:hypothetical protein SAMN05421812_10383 [Asanoa hainanensis]|uniref:Uncharacterized protein n=1 Tax=Asanoa hainanensis TaxID=560556 RepID=A0A239JRZ4_9ACTN|nr:hypothetical protein SAMN05421812_10383 [Asanoa hainanensis]
MTGSTALAPLIPSPGDEPGPAAVGLSAPAGQAGVRV